MIARVPEDREAPQEQETEAATGSSSHAPRVDLAQGQVIAKRYRLDVELGHGGMGVVWAATHLVTRRRVAMKFVSGPVNLRTDLRRRFLREAQAASAVNHPNVVEVLDVFELDNETPVMVMELLSGETLRDRLTRDKKLPLAQAASILLPVIAAVGSAHALGIVHRDLKPENIFLVQVTGRGEGVKVLDFGIAKLIGLESEGAETDPITGTGSMLGTPCYMAPEQTLGEKNIDHRADIWSLGVVLYECLTGVRPVQGLGLGQVVMRLATEGITPLDGLVPGLPKEVAALVMRMLARERARRPQDLREVHDTLARLTRQDSLPFPRTAISQRMPVEAGPPPSLGPAPIVDTQSPQAVPRRPRRTPRRSLFVCIAAGGVLATAFASWRLSAPTPVAHRTDDRVRGTVAPSAAALPTPSLSPPPLHTLAGDAPSAASSAQATDVDAAAVRTAVPAQRHPVPGHVLPPAATDERSATPTPSGSQTAPVKATAAGGLAEKPPF